MRFIELTGRQFNSWTVLGVAGRNSPNHLIWLCRSKCGTEKAISGDHVRRSASKRCGCLRQEVMTIHGHSGTGEYLSYSNTRARPTNPSAPNWEYYGGRGIEFRFNDFQEFYAELGPRPEGMTLDRIHNDGHYEPGNVRWSTPKEQAWNRRSNLEYEVAA
jgi:hypothetical protein